MNKESTSADKQSPIRRNNGPACKRWFSEIWQDSVRYHSNVP